MPDHNLTRRSFAAAFVGGAAGLATSAAAAADDPKAPAADFSSAQPIELWLELVRRIDPKQLTPEHLELIRGDLEVNLQRSARLSAFALTNADEPAPVFAAWRSEG